MLPGLTEWFGAFWELSTERPLGYGAVGSIPASAIEQWAQKAQLDEAEADLFHHCIRSLDRAYLSRVNKSGEDKPAEKPVEKPLAPPDEIVSERPLSPALFDTLFAIVPHKIGEVVSDEPIKSVKPPRKRKNHERTKSKPG